MAQKLEAFGGAVKFRDSLGGWQIGRIIDKRPLPYQPSPLVFQLHQVFHNDVTAHAMWKKYHHGDFPSYEAFLSSLVCVLASEKESLMAQALEHERNLTGH